MANKFMEGWTVEEEVAEVKLGRKKYKNMARVSRPCQTCSKLFEIWVTQKVTEGKAANDSLRLRNCEEHRGAKSAGPGWQWPVDFVEGHDESGKPNCFAGGFDNANAAIETLMTRSETLFAIVRKLQSVMPAATVLNVEQAVTMLIDGGNKLRADAQKNIDMLVVERDALKAKLAAFDLPAAMAAMPWQK